MWHSDTSQGVRRRISRVIRRFTIFTAIDTPLQSRMQPHSTAEDTRGRIAIASFYERLNRLPRLHRASKGSRRDISTSQDLSGRDSDLVHGIHEEISPLRGHLHVRRPATGCILRGLSQLIQQFTAATVGGFCCAGGAHSVSSAAWSMTNSTGSLAPAEAAGPDGPYRADKRWCSAR